MTDTGQFLGLTAGHPFDTGEFRVALQAPYEYEMWLCGGQSNAAGAAGALVAELLPGGIAAALPNLFMVEGEGAIMPARAGQHYGPQAGAGIYSTGGVSAFAEFCRLRAQMYPDRKILMCSAALGGTKLIGGPWDSSIPGACIFKLRGMLSTVLNNTSVKVHVGGFWWQGHESDGFAGETAANYKAAFLALRTYLINGLSDVSGTLEDRPWLLASFHDHWIADGVAPNVLAPGDPGVSAANMRAVHQGITEMCREQETFHYVRTDDLEVYDGIHWDQTSQRKLGRRLFRAANKALTDIRGGLEYRGAWTPNTSFPADARKGYFYTATAQTLVAFPLPESVVFLPGDILLALLDNPRTDTYTGQWLRIKQQTFESFARVSVFTGQIVNNVSDNPVPFLKVNPALDAIRGMATVRQSGFEAMGTFLGQGVLANHLLFNYGATATWVHASNYINAALGVQGFVEMVRTASNLGWSSLIVGGAGGRYSQIIHDFNVLVAKFYTSLADGFGSGLDVQAPSMHTSLQSIARAQLRTDNATNRTTVRVNPTNVEVFSGATGGDGTKIATVLANGDVELHVAGRGLILASPDGTRYKATMTNAGAWTIALA